MNGSTEHCVPKYFDELLDHFHAYLRGVDDALVRDAVARIDWNLPARALEPHPLPCVDQLDRIVDLAPPDAQPLVRLLADRRNDLQWGQTYNAADFGAAFLQKYGWLEVFGLRGHFVNDEVAAGLLILGPGITYPDHHHIAEEIYIPLTGGTEWRMGEGDFHVRQAGEVIHHASNVSHAMRTGSEPLLALYIWRGGPLAQKSTIPGAQDRG
jgi:mannose-6-phosphate isomerase-like protein (cupin superfamily)